MSIVVTIISNITALVPDNFLCFGYFMPLSHDVNKKVLLQCSPLNPPPNQVFTRFSPSLFVDLQEILYEPFFALI